MSNVAHSIQEYCKKINSRLTYADLVTATVLLLGITFLLVYIHQEKARNFQEIVYEEGDFIQTTPQEDQSLPFASKSGKTYTFSWCSGSAKIKEKNKITFASEEQAKASGRILSKLCQK